ESQGDLRGELVRLDPFVHFKWRVNDYESPEIKTNLVGRYNFINFLAAAAVGFQFNIPADDINSALTTYLPSNNRSQVQRTERNTLIVDCYNANATSMKAALESFSEVEHPNKLAIVGDMLEMGDISFKEHQEIVYFLKEKKIRAILVGKEFTRTDH